MHHETAMAQDIIRAALKQAREKGLEKIFRVKVKVGETRLANEDYLRRGFEMAASGTILSQAKLEVQISPLRARCAKCKGMLDKGGLICPSCGTGNIEIASGQELLVELVE